MRKLTFSLFLCLLASGAWAQKYRTAAGLRIQKEGFGLSVQQKIMERTTLEGILGFSNREVSGTLLVEKHFPFLGKGFNYYLGGGAHVGNLKNNGAFFGGDAIIGTEMKLPLFPLVLSLDLKPAVHVNHEDWFNIGGGFTIRYILVKEKKEKKKLFGIFGGGDDDDDDRDRKKNKKKNTGKDNDKPRIFNW